MIASYPEDSGESGGTVFKDPLPYLHHFNEEIQESGYEPIFDEVKTYRGEYDVTRRFDFRSWPEVEGMKRQEVFSEIDVPDSRIRVIGEQDGQLIHACYEKFSLPVSGSTYQCEYTWIVSYRYHSWEHCTCPNAKLTMIGQELYHDECGRIRETKVDGPLDEHVMSLSIAPPDDMYNGYYPTIPGNDVAHYNPGARGMDAHRGGDVIYGSTQLDNQDRVIDGRYAITGGTEIRGGRAEHRQKTKGMILWDSGTQRDIDKVKAEKKEAQRRKNRAWLDAKIIGQGPIESLGI